MRLNSEYRLPATGNGIVLLMVLAAALLFTPASAFAQGSIFGTVQNADLSTPADGQILFFGFLDDTDEEIRIEVCDGAGYQAGNWFDDFQNYLTEAAGNQYDYYFVNTTNGQYFHLGKVIPNNSFQQENIVLASGSLPTRPANVAARAISSSKMLISWSGVSGLTYHVYRRVASSNGSFYRIDHPAGSLANVGVADSFFVDTAIDGVSAYAYVVIAQNAGGDFSAHSNIVTGNSTPLTAPVVSSISPATGPSVGGTSVAIFGLGFDAAGVSVTIDGSPATGVSVVNAGRINATTPAGSGPANIVVTNTASALAGTLTNGFNYFANSAPVANAGPDQLGLFKNTLITLNGTASSDVDLDSLSYNWLQTSGPVVTLSSATASQPTFTAMANGDYFFRLIVSDGIVSSTPDTVRVQVVERAPVLAAIGPRFVNEGVNLNFNAAANDPDGTIPTLSAVGLPSGATFNDNLNGSGTFNFTPTFVQSGVYNVTFVASDGVLADSEVVTVTVSEGGNQPPVLAAIGPRNVNEGAVLNINITASDLDGTTPNFQAVNLPTNATLSDNGNGTATFNFAPNFTQAGVYNVTFIATDGILADSEVVAITVNQVNQAPILANIGPRNTNEGVNLHFVVASSDPDFTVPVLSAVGLPLGASYFDNGNATATFDWTPGFNQAGVFNVTFIASDGVLADSEVVTITVIDAGNQRPVLATIGNRAVQEGNVLQFRVSASDPDASTPTLTAFTVPVNATFVDSTNGAGSFTFSPNFNQSGLYTVLFVASDGTLADSEFVQITVGESGNLPPVLDSIGNRQVSEGNTLTILVHATDEAGIPDLLVSTTMNNYAFVDSGNGYGTLTYTPDYFDAGIDSITIFALDGDGAIDAEKIQITTLDINRAPRVLPIADVTAVPGDSVKIHIVATDSTDANGGRLYLLSLDKPATAVFTDSTNNRGSLRWLPTTADTGLKRFIVLVTDDETPALSSRDTTFINVVVANQPPVLASIGTKTIPEGQHLSFRISATDPDGTIPFFYAQNIPQGAVLIDSANGAGSFEFTPSFTQSGLYSIKIYASDGNKTDNETVLIQVTNVPQPPILTVPVDTQFVTEGDTLLFGISATDPDLTIPQLKIDSTLVPPINSVFIDSANGRGSFRFAPVFVQAGLYDLTFIATDGQRSDTGLVIVSVLDAGNQTPILTVKRGSTTLNDGDTTVATETDVIRITLSTTDADSVLPSLSSTTPLPFTATFTDSANGRGAMVWQTANLELGIYNITFYAVDGDDNQIVDSSRIVIRLNDANQPPNPISYNPISVCPSFFPVNCGPKSIAEGTSFSVTFHTDDVDGTDPIMSARLYTATLTDTTILFSTPLPANMSVNDMGDSAIFTFSPNYQQAGNYFIAMLGIDAVYPTVYVKSLWQFTVTNVSVPPVLNTIGPLSVLEGQTLDVSISGTDPDGTPVSITSSTLPTGATLTALTGQPSGTATSRLLYTPSFTAAGTYNVVFRCRENFAPNATDTEIVAITVIEAGPQAPVLVDLNPSYQVNITNEILRLYLRATDVDSPAPTLTYSGQPIAPWNGVLVDSANGRGSYTFDPIANQKDSTYNLRFIATTAGDGRADTMFVAITVIDGICGDADGNGIIAISDVVYLINYIFGGGPAPSTTRRGDANGDCLFSISDATYLINYIFAGGAAPNCPACP